MENTYELQSWYPHPKDQPPGFFQMGTYSAQAAILKDFPQAVGTAYLQDNGPVFLKDGQAYSTKNWMFTNADFLKVVSLPLIAGSTLPQPQTAVLTQSEATKRFGTDQVVGRTLTIISRGIRRDFKITGVLKDVPKNSSLKIDAILRLDFPAFYADQPEFLTKCWGCQSGYVFVKMRPGTDIKQIQAQMPAWEKRNIPDEPNGDIMNSARMRTIYASGTSFCSTGKRTLPHLFRKSAQSRSSKR